ncbi:PD-(D/E)XK nuclease domain-containing protein, partial [Thermodesulfatator autotrophicus]|uniref:PD-(D/E)XK nuclease domain-containing protein n=1 Tax=Thermodesulfatator autotrophicus TaxID=1795632 RepID=UPI000A625391
KKYFIPELENLEAGENILEAFDIDCLEIETILFQTGYLTIKDLQKKGPRRRYSLSYPNLEVKMSFADSILNWYVERRTEKERIIDRLYDVLEASDLEKLKVIFKSFFASIPHDWYRKTELHHYEGFYASVFYCYFTALGVDVRVEEAVSHGRLDMAVIFERRCYLFEFKVVELEPEGKALEQLKSRGYHEKYVDRCQEIYLIGVEFSKKERNIVGFEWEKIRSI